MSEGLDPRPDVGMEPYSLSEDRVPDVDLGFLDDAGEDPISRLFLSTYGDKQWIVNNSTFHDYSRRAYIGGSTSGLSRLVDERLGGSEGAVGMDLAAGTEARALRDLMDSGILEQALATNYRARVPRRLSRNNLDHIRGNLTHRETWQKILGWKDEHAPDGFDLVMHRPVGGLQDLDPRMYQAAGRVLFGMVRPGGMMFSQVPRQVMNVDGGLRGLCQSIREDGAVERVVTTGQRPSRIRLPKDESDFYAVVFKKD